MTTKLQDRTDAMLDQALEMTFPASDPFTIYFPDRISDRTDAEHTPGASQRNGS